MHNTTEIPSHIINNLMCSSSAPAQSFYPINNSLSDSYDYNSQGSMNPQDSYDYSFIQSRVLSNSIKNSDKITNRTSVDTNKNSTGQTTSNMQVETENKLKKIRPTEPLTDDKTVKRPTDNKIVKRPTDDKTVKPPTDNKNVKRLTDEKSVRRLTDEKTAKRPTDDKTVKRLTDDKTVKRLTDDKIVKRLSDDKTVKRLTDVKTVKRPTDDKTVKRLTDDKNMKRSNTPIPLSGVKRSGSPNQERSKSVNLKYENKKDIYSQSNPIKSTIGRNRQYSFSSAGASSLDSRRSSKLSNVPLDSRRSSKATNVPLDSCRSSKSTNVLLKKKSDTLRAKSPPIRSSRIPVNRETNEKSIKTVSPSDPPPPLYPSDPPPPSLYPIPDLLDVSMKSCELSV
eukprot:GHVL01041376.1.p1 GENE.GHVL01041376.1~~GHVL01041376.1.p1  ORF type:complete len:458 (+),score=151.30 GHVL01041376.1:190-1374(+)